MEKKKILLPRKKFYNAIDEDLDIRVNLDESQILLRENEKNIILDIDQLFSKERNESVKYKIHGKLKMVFRNQYEGTSPYEPLARSLYLNDETSNNGNLPYNEYAFLRNDVVREKNLPISGTTLTDYTPNIVFEGYTGHTIITPYDAPYVNWNIYISYVHDHDEDYEMTYTLSGDTNGNKTYKFSASDGIPFKVEVVGKFFRFTSPVEHGINEGEYLIVSDTPLYVSSLGNETHNSEKFVINVLETDIPMDLTFDEVVTGKRCIDIKDQENTTSNYYVHIHKTLTDSDDYILDKIGFESPIWKEERKILFENVLGENDVIVEKNRMEALLFDFKEPLLFTGVTNNLGYTPTDVYLTVVNRNGNGYFNYPPKIGYKFNFHDTWIDNHFSGNTSLETNLTSTELDTNTSGYTFYGGNFVQKGTNLIGNFIEYIPSELKEREVSNVFHKLIVRRDIFDHGQTDNTKLYGASINNQMGLFYQPHYKIKLRELSPYIESEDTEEVANMPENAKYFEDEGVWKWRDLYDHGFIDTEGNGVNHPFINGIHYVKTDVSFYLRNEQNFKNKQNGLNKFTNTKFDC
jgi:hypothetical protein